MRCVTKRAPRIEWMMLYLGDKKDCKVDEILEVGLILVFDEFDVGQDGKLEIKYDFFVFVLFLLDHLK